MAKTDGNIVHSADLTAKDAASCQSVGAKNCHFIDGKSLKVEVEGMKKSSERGFSIIELLVVCVVIGIIAAIAVPHLQKAVRGAEIGSTFAIMRTISSTQMNFYTQNSRFGNLGEINNILSSGIGTQIGNDIYRSKFVYSMTPAVPSPAELREGYIITATRDVTSEGIVYQFEVTNSNEIRQILPAP